MYDRVFANVKANQDKKNKLSSIKSNNAKTKESKGKQPAEANTDKTGDVAKTKPKRDVSSAIQEKSSGVDMSLKRKRDDEEDLQEPDYKPLNDDGTYQKSSRLSKKLKASVDPAIDGGTSSDESVSAAGPAFSHGIEDVLSTPPHPPAAESTSGKKRNKRGVVEETDDEFPVASKKKARRSGRYTAQPISNLKSGGVEDQDDPDAEEPEFTAQPARSRAARRVATKTPKGAQPDPKSARANGGA